MVTCTKVTLKSESVATESVEGLKGDQVCSVNKRHIYVTWGNEGNGQVTITPPRAPEISVMRRKNSAVSGGI